jgi:hypothetical protein
MATLNYSRRLQNLQQRKFDPLLNESMLSKSFSRIDIPEDLKYLIESMQPIPDKSTLKSREAISRVENHLENGFDLSFTRAYRNQGSLQTNTHINASDCDFLAIINGYYYTGPNVPIIDPYKGVPSNDIKEFRRQAVKIMKDTYDEVNDTNEKCISIRNKSLGRKVDIVFAFWYNIQEYINTNDEYYRGVKFKPDQIQADFPFAHIRCVNNKGNSTYDGSRKAIRLLKTLKADCVHELTEVKSFHITGIVHSLSNENLIYYSGREIFIARAISNHLDLILDNSQYRKSIKSPNGCENVFADDNSLHDLKIIKGDLDTLLEDASKDLKQNNFLEKALIEY